MCVFFRLCLGLSDLQATDGRAVPRGPQLLQQDGLHFCLLAHHDGLHLPGPVHFLYLLLQHRLRHTQKRILRAKRTDNRIRREEDIFFYLSEHGRKNAIAINRVTYVPNVSILFSNALRVCLCLYYVIGTTLKSDIQVYTYLDID